MGDHRDIAVHNEAPTRSNGLPRPGPEAGHLRQNSAFSMASTEASAQQYAGTNVSPGPEHAQETSTQSRASGQTGGFSIENDVMHTVVSSSKDALGLLFKAVEQQEASEIDDETNGLHTNYPYESPGSALTASINAEALLLSPLSSSSRECLELWEHLRFVRQGWMSAREAVTYIDL